MDKREKKIGKKGGVLMRAPPGRALPGRGGSKKPAAARVSGGSMALGDGRARPSAGGAPSRGPSDAADDDAPDRKKRQKQEAREAAADARRLRLAAFEKREAEAKTRERLNEFECAICFEEFKSSTNPTGVHRVACLPCGHAMYCAGCAAQFRTCPHGCEGFRGTVRLFL
mmetsp:Transcript_11786/g.35113  ORF Transcript_11786/g.35113 Transcript_11786/m.35113 type:complete len:170 (-) Transcript_11786:11-520(-)